jgi:16S rRNA (uracil1498-N3)-methyltransferase
LRARSGDVFEVVSVDRRLFLAELRGGREAVVLEELSAPERDDALVVLYQAVPKGRHMDLVVEKATEIGVDRIVPLATDRGVVRLDGAASKVQRWRRVAEAAARQSLRLRVPEVAEPAEFPEATRNEGGRGILLHNGEELPRLEEVVGAATVSLFVGPEGGWSEAEIAVAGDSGLSSAQLGPYRLRSETAGVVAVARARAALEASVAHT